MTTLALFAMGLVVLSVVLILPGGISGFICYALLVRRLRLHHVELWRSLGAPSYVPAFPPPDDYWYGALFDWIMRKDYLTGPDPNIQRLGRTSRLLFRGVFVGLGCIALATFFGLVIMLQGI